MSSDLRKIFIVDDEETIHRALQRTLRREPYELIHAYDSAEAAALLERHDDVAGIVCDHYMPGLPGLEFLMEVRRRHPRVVTILLTAQADLQLVLAAINDGRIHAFLTKPWSADDLRARLRDLLRSVDERGEIVPAPVPGVAERLADDLLPPRDATGAFIIDAPT
jgi:DNA-binding NtrC family response regulator